MTCEVERLNPSQVSISRLANLAAKLICEAFHEFHGQFQNITQRARRRFAARDWRGMHADSAERLDVYSHRVAELEQDLCQLLGERLRSRLMWGSTKAVYSGLIDDRHDCEIAETYFNSVTRRIFTTVGVDADIEFVHSDYETPPRPGRSLIFRPFSPQASTAELIHSMLSDFDLPWSASSLPQQAVAAAEQLDRLLAERGADEALLRVEMVTEVFYRGECAYLIGRLVTDSGIQPLVLCLRHVDDELAVDAVLVDENDVSLLFGFTRSYFHVVTERPRDLVDFVHSLIPRKPVSEIYTSLGYNKHGKTELYRDLLHHLSGTVDRFERARGLRGMVMTVFTMPSYPVVFKIIRDQFDAPKSCTRQSVLDRYRLVFKHDRAGRLIDAQEFQFLEFDRSRFRPELLEELLEVAAATVELCGSRVVVKHCYVERRVVPLNIYLQEANPADAQAAVLDYGQAIKDLARTNIFPGDLLLKNFGVTRQKRVVFYDYDELCWLTECRIRKLPECDDFDLEMSAAPWFAVGDQDMFPEEFAHLLECDEAYRELFIEHHGDLLDVPFWRDVQARVKAGELFHAIPYAHAREQSLAAERLSARAPYGRQPVPA